MIIVKITLPVDNNQDQQMSYGQTDFMVIIIESLCILIVPDCYRNHCFSNHNIRILTMKSVTDVRTQNGATQYKEKLRL